MNREELEALRQELDRQGCDTYMRDDMFNEEYVSYSSAGGKNFYGFNIDFDAIASRCYRSDRKRIRACVWEEQTPYHWDVAFERGENNICLTVHPRDGYILTEIIGVDCLLEVFPELVAYAQKYLARNWERITDDFWKEAYEDCQCS